MKAFAAQKVTLVETAKPEKRAERGAGPGPTPIQSNGHGRTAFSTSVTSAGGTPSLSTA